MDLSDKKMLRRVLNRLSSNLGITLDSNIKDQFFSGKNQDFLHYSKTERNELKIPAIIKYMLGVESYLAQPSKDHYYDIISAGRIIPITVALEHALRVLKTRNVYGYEERVQKLLNETNYDKFESTMYELIVAAKYASKTKKGNVRFIKETHIKSPDIEARIRRRDYLIECKKPDRENNASLQIKEAIRKKLEKTFGEFFSHRYSAVMELSIHTDPNSLDENEILQAAIESYGHGNPILNKTFTLKVEKKEIRQSPYLDLYPAPGYFAKHFDYYPEGEWQGIIPVLDCTWSTPGWIDNVNSYVAVKWKITDEEQIWRIKRIGYALIFKGFEQLNQTGSNVILHYWFETDRNIGSREKELRHLVETLFEKNIKYDWLVLNETSPSLSPLGRFDFVENAHYSRGMSSIIFKGLKMRIPVTNVFLFDEDTFQNEGPFGVGAPLIPIDLFYELEKFKK